MPTATRSAVSASTLVVRDVVEDAYGNPAIVLRVNGGSVLMLQLVGSDRGRIASSSSLGSAYRVDAARAAWAQRSFEAFTDAERARVRRQLGLSR